MFQKLKLKQTFKIKVYSDSEYTVLNMSLKWGGRRVLNWLAFVTKAANSQSQSEFHAFCIEQSSQLIMAIE